MYSLDTSLTKAGGTFAWSKTLQGELQELRNSWDPLQNVAFLGQDISGSSFQTSKRLVDVVSRIWALAFGMFEDFSLKV